MADVTDANSFALRLYRELAGEKPGDNLFFSPTSIRLALAMAAEGARGRTAEQMSEVLGGSAAGAGDGVSAAGGLTGIMNIANAMWVANQFPLLADYVALVRGRYDAGLFNVDFAGDPESAREQINTWVAAQTNQLIRDLIPPSGVSELTRLVLTNAIYFKGQWTRPFKDSATRPAEFLAATGAAKRVPMMAQEARFRYGTSVAMKVRALALPYEGRRLSMLVLLPDDGESLQAVESRLTIGALNALHNDLARAKVSLKLPRFKLNWFAAFGKYLRALGITDAFTPNDADFSGTSELAGSDGLYVSEVAHKAFVEVNEEGTEAAAATANKMRATKSKRKPPEAIRFHVNRPFLFLIRDEQSGEWLFMGRVTNLP